jgi:outer membrane protein insertion porin family
MNPNEETKEVDVTFSAEKGSKIYVKRIDITGNHQTKDDLIRRQMTFQEGDVITSQNLDVSRDKVLKR